MVFAASKGNLKRRLNGIAAEIQGTDYSEIAYETSMFYILHFHFYRVR
jgi:cofilin